VNFPGEDTCYHTHYEGGPHCIHTAWVVGFERGERDMLAKCIEAVDGVGNRAGSWRASDQPSEDYFVAIVDALTALRSLQEKP
jgi:hypothetical protein